MMCQVADRHPPRLTDRGRSTGQGNILEMSGTFEVNKPGDEYFSAPNMSVGAVTSPIQCESDHPSFKMILRHATGDVRVVVLHANQLRSTLLQRPLGGEVVGMKIVGDDLRLDFENPLQMHDRFVEKSITFHVLQISDVLAQESVLSFGEADGVFEFASDGQHRRLIVLQENRYRNKTAGTPQLPCDAASNSHHGIVAAQQDVTVMHQEVVGESVQSIHRFSILNCDRLLAQVAAGHHQSLKPSFGEQQVMKRRVRQKTYQVAVEGRNLIGDYAGGFLRQKNNGPLDRFENLARRIIEFADFFCSLQIRNHHGERLLHPALPLAQQSYRGRVRCIDCQVETAQTFYRNDESRMQAGDRFVDGIAAFDTPSRSEE